MLLYVQATPASTSNALMRAALAEIDRGTLPSAPLSDKIVSARVTVGLRYLQRRQDTIQTLTEQRRQMSVVKPEESTGELWEV